MLLKQSVFLEYLLGKFAKVAAEVLAVKGTNICISRSDYRIWKGTILYYAPSTRIASAKTFFLCIRIELVNI